MKLVPRYTKKKKEKEKNTRKTQTIENIQKSTKKHTSRKTHHMVHIKFTIDCMSDLGNQQGSAA